MTFSKFIAANSELQSAIFDSCHGALFAINGRLSGFYPFPVDNGDPGTPGISSTTLTGGGTARSITVSLSVPTPADDLRFSESGQLTSCAIVNGVVLESDAVVPIDMTIIEAEGVTLVDPDPISIFVTYDNYGADPVFDIKRESVIDASPQMIAKLAFYDSETQTWQPYPAVSLRGIYQRLVDISTRLDGFRVTIDVGSTPPRRLLVSPGFITGQFGRIINSSVSIVIPPAPPLTWRKDVVFVNDPGAENLPITFTMLSGAEVASSALAKTEPPPRPTSPRMVALAEIVLTTTGVVEVIDIRPVQAWATDALQQHKPAATETVNISTLQPGLSMVDLIPGADKIWEILIMRGKDTLLGIANKSKLVVGLVGPETERSFTAPDSGSLTFVPTANQFPAVPYIIKASLRFFSVTTGLDITNDPAYNINFDLLNGRFVPSGIAAQSFSELIRVTFRQLRVLFAIDDDGNVSIPELALIRKHIAANSPFYKINEGFENNPLLPGGLDISDSDSPTGSNRNLPYTTLPDNPAAHTGSNLVFNNRNPGPILPGGAAIPSFVSVQKAIEILASTTRPPPPNPLAGKQFSINWRMRNFHMFVARIKIIGDTTDPETWESIETNLFYHFLGPSGLQSVVESDESEGSWPLALPPNADGTKFWLPTAKALGGSISFFGRDSSTLNASVGNDVRFRIWIDNQNFEMTNLTYFKPGIGTERLGVRGIFTVPDPLTTLITRGSRVALAALGPTPSGGAASSPGEVDGFSAFIDSLSVNLFVELL